MEYNQLTDSVKRKALIKHFLAGETNLAEERLLIQWFKQNAPEEDEKQVASLIGALSLPTVSLERALSDDDVHTFDELVNRKYCRRRLIWKVLAVATSAAAIVVALVLWPRDKDNREYLRPSSEEIIESIVALYDISLNEISCMTAEPIGQDVILTVQLTDNNDFSFIVSKNQVDGSIRLLASNR